MSTVHPPARERSISKLLKYCMSVTVCGALLSAQCPTSHWKKVLEMVTFGGTEVVDVVGMAHVVTVPRQYISASKAAK